MHCLRRLAQRYDMYLEPRHIEEINEQIRANQGVLWHERISNNRTKFGILWREKELEVVYNGACHTIVTVLPR